MSEAAEKDIDSDIEDADIEIIEEKVEEAPGEVLPLEDHEQHKRVIEALLFASPEAVSLRAMQGRLPQSADVGRILLELQEKYADGGVNLVQMEDVWAFRTAPDVGPHLAITKKEEKKLSRAALETMAIIAYHQPVTRAEVENIRGVATSKGTLDVLMESGWIKPGRRRETPGRPVTWTTTNTFLDDFGISNLNDLPGLQELKASGLLDTRPAIETIPGDLFNSANENISEEEKERPLGEFDQETDDVEDTKEEENEDMAQVQPIEAVAARADDDMDDEDLDLEEDDSDSDDEDDMDDDSDDADEDEGDSDDSDEDEDYDDEDGDDDEDFDDEDDEEEDED